MKRAIIFANGFLGDPEPVRSFIRDDDLIIAADNGAAHCKQLSITPHAIIGDMDSIDPSLLADYEKDGVTVIRHPAEKNETDLELALTYAQAQGAREIILFGIVGDRWDMTLANALILAQPAYQALSLRAINGKDELIVTHANRMTNVHGAPRDLVSLIPLFGPVEGITLKGCRYPLENENLPFGSGRGVSNELLEPEGSLWIKKGTLLCIITHAGDSCGQ